MTTVELSGVQFLGTTLWSHLPNKEAARKVESCLNDYRLIHTSSKGRNQNKVITAADTSNWYDKQLKWLRTKLKSNAKRLTVVLTHHTPSMIGTSDPKYENQPVPECYVNCGFSSPLDDLILNSDNLVAWCYGHTHYNNVQIRENKKQVKTFLLSNQRGYQHESVSNSYRDDFVIQISPDGEVTVK
mmetsp:Transcript_11448/g.14251  ORF Transcript_11448/g.14251 Transcript_11448/m.14251 type:complete len:186 (+) Transcript_11448:1-558(+)